MKDFLFYLCLLSFILPVNAQTIDWYNYGSNIRGTHVYYSDLSNDETRILLVEDTIYTEPSTTINKITRIKVVERIGNQWVQLGNNVLPPSGIYPSNSKFCFGDNGNTVAVKFSRVNPDYTWSNYLKVYKYNVNEMKWKQLGNITLPDTDNKPDENFVANNDCTVLAYGINHGDQNNIDAAIKVIEYNGTDWVQKGEIIYGTKKDDFIYSKMCLNFIGDKLAVSSSNYTTNTSDDTAYVRTFEYLEGNWVQRGNDVIIAEDNTHGKLNLAFNKTASILAVASPYYAVGAPWGKSYGLVKVYSFNEAIDDWSQIGDNLCGRKWSLNYKYQESLGYGGISLSDDGDIIACGSTVHPKVFEYKDNVWLQKGNIEVDDCHTAWSKLDLNGAGNVLLALHTHSFCVLKYDIVPEKYNIHVSFIPENSGFIMGSRICQDGDCEIIEAIAKDGYVFDKWTQNNIDISNNSKMEVCATENMHFTAHFTDESSTKVEVVFKVNMIEEVTYNQVGIIGSWNNWQSAVLLNKVNDLYQTKLEFDRNTTLEYKFVKIDNENNIVEWEQIPETCGVGEYLNRSLSLSTSNIDLNPVCFNSCEDCGTSTNIITQFSDRLILPNPTMGIVEIYMDNIKKISVYNIQGHKINCVKTYGDTLSMIDISNQANGIYFIEILTNEIVLVKKVILKN